MYLPGKGFDEEERTRRGFLADWAASSNVPFLDLTGPIYSAGISETYLVGNFHWNAFGHELAAQQIESFIRGFELAE